MLRATVLSTFPFLGKKRSPGDVIEWEELNDAMEKKLLTRTVLDALKNQKLILLQGDGIEPEAAERIKGLEDRLDRIEELLTRLVGEKEAGSGSETGRRGKRAQLEN